MSSTPQGPGWWRASDGRWYPPQAPVVVVKNNGCLKALGVVVAVVLLLILLVVGITLLGSGGKP